MKKTILLALACGLATIVSAQAPQSPIPEKNTSSQIFTVVEKQPEYPGGMESLYQFIAANINYPEACKEQKISGKVYVTFVIEEDGSISNIRVLRDPDPEGRLGEEAMRVVSLMPKWKPGAQRGKAVRVQYNLPVNFTLN